MKVFHIITFNQMLLQLIDVPHLFLINMSCVLVSVGVSWICCTDVIFMQPGVKVNDAYYCDVLLLKQLLPDICQAAGDFYFPVHHTCARALICCDTRLQTSHQMWPPNRPDLSSVDYRLLTVIQNAFIRNSKERQTSLMSCGY